MMTSNASFFLYFSIIVTALLFREKKIYILGVISIATSLSFMDLPDILEYKEHYQLADGVSYEELFALYNFEPGYVILVKAASSIFSFEIFYILIVSLAVQSYLKFFDRCVDTRAYIYAIFFLSMCLYFVAFTLRSTIASMFLAYALLRMKDGKNTLSAALIVFGATFHIAVAPMIILPIANKFSKIIAGKFLTIYPLVIAFSILIFSYFSLDYLKGINEILDLKILAYEDANIISNGIYYGLWILAIFCSYISFENFDELDRVMVVILAAAIIMFSPFGFIQGRFMWLTSFIFAYIFVKSTFASFDLGTVGRLFFVMTLPLVIFLRF